MTRPLTDLCITRRARMLLVGAGIQTIEALCERSAADLLNLRGFGVGCLRDVREELKAAGVALAGEMAPCWVPFGDVARQRCGQQAQYASRAINGAHGYPDLSRDLRFQGDPARYLWIHKDDVEEFVRRWHEWKAGRDPFAAAPMRCLRHGAPGCSCDANEAPALTPSEIALAKILAAWEAWPNAAVADPVDDTLLDLGAPLLRNDWITEAGTISPMAAALLDRARRAGVL